MKYVIETGIPVPRFKQPPLRLRIPVGGRMEIPFHRNEFSVRSSISRINKLYAPKRYRVRKEKTGLFVYRVQ